MPSVRDGLRLTAANYLLVDELHDHSGTPFNVSSGNRFARNYVRSFLVEMNDPKWGVLEACLAPGLPTPYSPFINPYTGFFDGLALCVKIDAKRKVEKSPVWIVQCDYSTELPVGGIPNTMGYPTNNRNQSPSGAENNPELEPPEFEFDFEEVMVPARRDLDGRPFVNSSYEPFTPTPTIPFNRTVFHLTRNELDFDMTVAGYYGGTVNSKPFGNWPRDSVLCLPPKARMMQKGGLLYWRVSYQLKFGYRKSETSYESFQHEELDQGSRERFQAIYGTDVDGGTPGDPVIDGNGDPVWRFHTIVKPGNSSGTPTLLDGNGRVQKNQMKIGTDPATGDSIYGPRPIYQSFRIRRRTDFRKLFQRGLGFKSNKRRRGMVLNPVNPLGNNDL